MILYLVNKDKLQFLLVLPRLLFDSGVAKPHTAFKLCLVFNDVHKNRLFLLSLHSLKFLHLHVFSFYLFDTCKTVLLFSVQPNKNLVMTTGCGWGLVRIWGHLAISAASHAYSAHLSCGFFSKLPCLVRCGILLCLCFGRAGKHHLSYIGENWCSLRYCFSPTRESNLFFCEVYWCIKNESYVLGVWKNCSMTVGRAVFLLIL